MKKISFIILLVALGGCSNSDNPYGAMFDNNGCLVCDNYKAGETFMLKGLRYEVVDRTRLLLAIDDNEDLSRFCTSKVSDMSSLFENQSIFNQNISSWDVSSVTDMSWMFEQAYSFNQDIGNWDVSGVIDMDKMFKDATSFNRDLSNWCVAELTFEPSEFSLNSALFPSNHPVWGTCP